MGHTPGMHSASESGRYTWDDFIALEEDDLRELIDGELVEVEVPTDGHEHVDPRERTLECLVLRDGVYCIAAAYADDETFRPASFEGLEIPLAKLWD